MQYYRGGADNFDDWKIANLSRIIYNLVHLKMVNILYAMV